MRGTQAGRMASWDFLDGQLYLRPPSIRHTQFYGKDRTRHNLANFFSKNKNRERQLRVHGWDGGWSPPFCHVS